MGAAVGKGSARLTSRLTHLQLHLTAHLTPCRAGGQASRAKAGRGREQSIALYQCRRYYDDFLSGLSEEETCGFSFRCPFGSLTLSTKRVEGGDSVKLLNACTCGDDGGDCAM